MCGIIGYTGKKSAQQLLISGLSRLEYRGYDSAGLAVQGDGGLFINKKKGKLSVLKDELAIHPLDGSCGIGHTRWATHGVPNDLNAHPHSDGTGKIAIVHNGIIENFHELKSELEKKKIKFLSDTDSEVIAHLVGLFYEGDLLSAVLKTRKKLKGSYAFVAIHRDEPGRLVGARKDSPLIAGIGEGENFLASDIPAVLERTKNVVYLENGEAADLCPRGIDFYDASEEPVEKTAKMIDWDISQAEKSGYKHFMLKEIFEQPQVIKGIIDKRVKGQKVFFEELGIKERDLKDFSSITIVACGTAYHAGLTAQYMIESLVRVPVRVETSSEFRYRDPLVDPGTLVVVISQSGETADTLAALREAVKRKAKVLAVCNVVGSSISREADGVIYTYAGPEIAVASTKAYTAQLASLYLFAFYLSDLKGTSGERHKKLLKEFKTLPEKIRQLLNTCEKGDNTLDEYAADFHEYYLARNNKSCFLYLGRNINFPNALEGALKLKEISYISAEGYPAGEMKHGPIALIDENPWVVCIVPKSRTYQKMLSNIQEIRARGGLIIAIVTEGDNSLLENKEAKYLVWIPSISEELSPILVAVPLQLLAYHVAREFGYDIDQPRNLAKSVTVE